MQARGESVRVTSHQLVASNFYIYMHWNGEAFFVITFYLPPK